MWIVFLLAAFLWLFLWFFGGALDTVSSDFEKNVTAGIGCAGFLVGVGIAVVLLVKGI